jgi:hypothetical protein
MAKIKLNNETITNILPDDLSELNKFITLEEITKLITNNLNKDYISNNTSMYFTELKKIDYNGWNIDVKMYIDVYSDITKVYSLKTCKCINNIINPYTIRISIFHNSENLFFYITNENIRTYKINSVEA